VKTELKTPAVTKKGEVKNQTLLHFTAIKIQVKHLDHLFRIYIKGLGEDTVCKVEEAKQSKVATAEFINNIFNPMERIEKQLHEISGRLDRLTLFQGFADCVRSRGA
jgi:hypothetical protein